MTDGLTIEYQEMANMMFPDTSNDQQLAALRHTAERSRAAGNSQLAYQHTTLQPFAPMKERFCSASTFESERYTSALEERLFACR